MKTKGHLLPIIGSVLVFLLVFISCAPARKSAVSCTEFPVYRYNKINHKAGKQTLFASRHRTNKANYQANSVKKQSKNIVALAPARDASLINIIDKIEFSKGLLASADNAIVTQKSSSIFSEKLQPVYTGSNYADASKQVSKCDTIVLKSGSVIFAKVEEISQTEVKYRRCDNLSGPLFSILKSDVSSIRYINGTRDNFNPVVDVTYSPVQNPQNNLPPQTQGLAIAGFLASVVGLFIASIPLGLLAIIFGGISLKKIRRSQGRLKGRGLAIAGIVIGIIDVVVMIALLAAV
jgi:hypothetical protein